MEKPKISRNLSVSGRLSSETTTSTVHGDSGSKR
ncbi:hypothetical protein V6Z12_D13G249500 [Gossypium hirsutum]